MFSDPHVETSDADGAIVIRPVGEFDLSGTDLLRSVFTEAITATSNRMVIDLSATTFLDSMALGTIIAAGKRTAGWGGWTRLVSPPANVRKVLRVTGIDTVLGLYDSVEAAVAHAPVIMTPVDETA
jgi:anti-sigma B factor antagonist